MKNVQIPYDLFVALLQYHLMMDDDYANEIRHGLEQKLEAMEVMFKGSAYVLCGELPHRFGTNEHMMLKIPMSAENEMESQYSISDIEIGKVTVLGIYRGEFDRRDVERKINRMMALNDSGKKSQQETNDIQDSGMDIEDGVREEDKKGIRNISLAQGKVHYIDVIAIIQDINI